MTDYARLARECALHYAETGPMATGRVTELNTLLAECHSAFLKLAHPMQTLARENTVLFVSHVPGHPIQVCFGPGDHTVIRKTITDERALHLAMDLTKAVSDNRWSATWLKPAYKITYAKPPPAALLEPQTEEGLFEAYARIDAMLRRCTCYVEDGSMGSRWDCSTCAVHGAYGIT